MGCTVASMWFVCDVCNDQRLAGGYEQPRQKFPCNWHHSLVHHAVAIIEQCSYVVCLPACVWACRLSKNCGCTAEVCRFAANDSCGWNTARPGIVAEHTCRVECYKVLLCMLLLSRQALMQVHFEVVMGYGCLVWRDVMFIVSMGCVGLWYATHKACASN